MRLHASKDTRFLIVGIAAVVALFVYLGVAFASTRHSVVFADEVAPWTPSAAKLTPAKTPKAGVYDVYVTPANPDSTTAGNYGAVIQTVVPNPTPGGRYVIGLSLRGAAPGRIGFELNEFRPGVARYPINTTVHATAGWHHYAFSTRVKGTWLGLAVYVYRPVHRGSWFAIRRGTEALVGH